MSETLEEKMKRIGDAIKRLEDEKKNLRKEFDLLVDQRVEEIRNQNLPKGHSSDGNCSCSCNQMMQTGVCYDCKKLQTCCHGQGTGNLIRHGFVSKYL